MTKGVKGRVEDELLKANTWLSVTDLVDLVGGYPTTCYSTVARALRKLWQEDKAAKMKLPGDTKGRMQWVAAANAKAGFPDAKIPTSTYPTRGKRGKKAAQPSHNIVSQGQGDLSMQIDQGVETVVGEFVTAGKRFSAHDVTKELREQVNSGKIQVDPGLAGTALVGGKTVTKIEHALVREAVHKLMTGGKYPTYDRATSGGFWEYFPDTTPTATTTAAADPAAPPTQDGGTYDGSSSL